MAISLTESAATRVLDHLQQRGKGLGLRLGVKKTGCSGFAYVINYADEIGDDDIVMGVVVAGKARAYPVNYMNGPRNEVVNDQLGGTAIASTW